MIFTQIRPYYRNKVSPDLVTQTAGQVLSVMDQEGDATIVITGNKEVHELNLSFRNIDAPTDVLSFSQEINDPLSGEKYLGDIVISYQKAVHQSRTEAHSLEDELRLLITHGMLHLLGYDHHSVEERKTMWTYQRKILQKLNVAESIFIHLESDQ